MNRYFIAALYVMAGCVVTVPLKVQGNPEPLKGERCRLIITTTVKAVSAYVDEQDAPHPGFDVWTEFFRFPGVDFRISGFSFVYAHRERITLSFPTSHKIRAPGR